MRGFYHLFRNEHIARHFVFATGLANIVLYYLVTLKKLWEIDNRILIILFVFLIFTVLAYFGIVRNVITVARREGIRKTRDCAEYTKHFEFIHSHLILIFAALIVTTTGTLFYVSGVVAIILMLLYMYLVHELKYAYDIASIVVIKKDKDLKIVAVEKYENRYYEAYDDGILIYSETSATTFTTTFIDYVNEHEIIICDMVDNEDQFDQHVEYIAQNDGADYQAHRRRCGRF